MPSGNLLGFNLWPGCDFSGTNSNTTTISGLNQLRLVNLQTSAPPTCSLSGGVANMSTGLIPFTFSMVQPLTVKCVRCLFIVCIYLTFACMHVLFGADYMYNRYTMHNLILYDARHNLMSYKY